MDMLDSLPVSVRKQVDGVLKGADTLAGEYAALKVADDKLNKDLATTVFERAVGKGGLNSYVDDLLKSKDAWNQHKSQMEFWKKTKLQGKGVDPAKAREALDDTIKVKMLDRAFAEANAKGKSPVDVMLNGENSEVFKAAFGKNLEQVKEVTNLVEMLNKFAVVKKQPQKIAGDQGDVMVAGTGQSIQSILGLVFNPIMSAKYVAATVAGRAWRYQLTKAEMEASYDMYSKPEQFKKLIEHGRSHDWTKFEQELAKIYDRQMALRAAYRGAIATENQVTQ
jgi:hypothetical protein